jgi:hypothetical protein
MTMTSRSYMIAVCITKMQYISELIFGGAQLMRVDHLSSIIVRFTGEKDIGK